MNSIPSDEKPPHPLPHNHHQQPQNQHYFHQQQQQITGTAGPSSSTPKRSCTSNEPGPSESCTFSSSSSWMRQGHHNPNHHNFHHYQNPRFPYPTEAHGNRIPPSGHGSPGTPSTNYNHHPQQHHHQQQQFVESNPRVPMSGNGTPGYDERFYSSSSKQDYYHHNHSQSINYEPRPGPSNYYPHGGPEPSAGIEHSHGVHGTSYTHTHCEHQHYDTQSPVTGVGNSAAAPVPPGDYFHGTEYSRSSYHQQHQHSNNIFHNGSTSSYVRSSTSCPSYEYHHQHHSHHNHHPITYNQQQQQQIQQQQFRRNSIESFSSLPPKNYAGTCSSVPPQPSSSWSPGPPEIHEHEQHGASQSQPIHHRTSSTTRQNYGDYTRPRGFSPETTSDTFGNVSVNSSCAYSGSAGASFKSSLSGAIFEDATGSYTSSTNSNNQQLFHGSNSLEFGTNNVQSSQSRSHHNHSFSTTNCPQPVHGLGNQGNFTTMIKPKPDIMECSTSDKLYVVNECNNSLNLKCESPSQSNIIEPSNSNGLSTGSLNLDSRPPSSCSNSSNPFPSTPTTPPIVSVKSEIGLGDPNDEEQEVNTPDPENICTITTTTTATDPDSEDITAEVVADQSVADSVLKLEDETDELDLNLPKSIESSELEPESEEQDLLLETPEVNTPISESVEELANAEESEIVEFSSASAASSLGNTSTGAGSSSLCDTRRLCVTSPIPHKVTKRSFSEADKELVINTSAIAAVAMAFKQQQQAEKDTESEATDNPKVLVPIGWKREVSNSKGVVYVSPSDTKLKTLDEVKNYITSDGTCKCGLSCPLRLETVFSFDSLVQNLIQEEEDSSVRVVATGFHCSHNHKNLQIQTQKRKVPLSEDSPLISSTREDLDPEEETPITPKRLKLTVTPETLDSKSQAQSPISSVAVGGGSAQGEIVPFQPSSFTNLPVPFPQQSPDTTTQTPKREMSPASSISSEASGSGIFYTPSNISFSPGSSSSSNGSLTSTTNNTNSQASITLHQGFKDFTWLPPVPQLGSTISNSNILITPTTSAGASKNSRKESSSSDSNTTEPPPLLHKTSKSQTNSNNPNVISFPIPGASHPRPHCVVSSSGPTNQLSFFPIVSSCSSVGGPGTYASEPTSHHHHQLQLPPGFTISPILQHNISSTSSPVVGSTQCVVSSLNNFFAAAGSTTTTYYTNTSQIPRLAPTQSTTTTLTTPSLPSSVSISLINDSQAATKDEPKGLESTGDKSHLDFVKEVVERYDKTSASSAQVPTTSSSTAPILVPISSIASPTITTTAPAVSSTILTSANPNTVQAPTPQLQLNPHPLILNPLQPFFGGCGPLIISPQTQCQSADGQTYVHIDQSQGNNDLMILDPSTLCGNPNILSGAQGPKKKKKRLSKKQQQQQAQLQLQQQLLLHQIQQQVQQQQQQQVAQQIPFLFPQSFGGFSLQPFTNFLPAPTILTLPNLILNPTDGTLFIQQSPAAPGGTVAAPGFSPAATTVTSSSSVKLPSQSPMSTSNKTEDDESKECLNSDDSSLQNQIPDSSTSDFPLGITIATGTGSALSFPIAAGTGGTAPTSSSSSSSRKGSSKAKAVSSSTSVKRVPMTPKQILPKIDSTTPSVENS